MKREIKAALSGNNLNTDGPRRRLLRNLLPLKSGVKAERRRVGVGPSCRVIFLVFLLMVIGLLLSLGTFPFWATSCRSVELQWVFLLPGTHQPSLPNDREMRNPFLQ